MKNKSLSWRLGYADAKFGIKTFPANGTDKFKTLNDFKQAILRACKVCQDREYASGAKAAFGEI